MKEAKEKQVKRLRRKKRVRAKIKGSVRCPRLSVSRSKKSMYLQLIDDERGITLASAHSRELRKKGKKVDISFELGKLIAKKAAEKKVKEIVFDRGSYKYHGRVEAVARGAREGGLKF